MSETTSPQETQARSRSKAVLLLPLVLVVGLLGLLYFALQSGDPSRLPSVLIGNPVPEFNLAAIPR
ncbi:MAG: DsbE family thiol:disulfide interchange protein, partial [Rhodomicrobium sp.]